MDTFEVRKFEIAADDVVAGIQPRIPFILVDVHGILFVCRTVGDTGGWRVLGCVFALGTGHGGDGGE